MIYTLCLHDALPISYLYFMPGVPIIYQGSEVPMYGPGFPENQYIVDFSSADPDLEDVFDKMASIRQQFPALLYGDVEQVAVDRGFSLRSEERRVGKECKCRG